MQGFDASIGYGAHEPIERYEARWGAPSYDAWGNKVQDPELKCRCCDLFGTADCTRDNCDLMQDGHEPMRYSEDEDDLPEATR